MKQRPSDYGLIVKDVQNQAEQDTNITIHFLRLWRTLKEDNIKKREGVIESLLRRDNITGDILDYRITYNELSEFYNTGEFKKLVSTFKIGLAKRGIAETEESLSFFGGSFRNKRKIDDDSGTPPSEKKLKTEYKIA